MSENSTEPGLKKRKLSFIEISIYIALIAITFYYKVYLEFKDTDLTQEPSWTKSEIALLQSLSIDALPALAPDPSNAVADDTRAAELGRKLFFDTRLSANGDIACASCHQPEQYFTDGLQTAEGLAVTNRNTPSLVGVAYSPWFFWDGRSDSQWSQALGPLEHPSEQGGDRLQFAHLIAEDTKYKASYEAIFGALPELADTTRFPKNASPIGRPQTRAAWGAMSAVDQQAANTVFTNLAKTLAAYQRTLLPGKSRFDEYIDAVVNNETESMKTLFSPRETAGLKIFIGKGNCLNCHNGPLLSNHGFQNIGVPSSEPVKDRTGRFTGVQLALASEFNCLGDFSDASDDDCAELRFTQTSKRETLGAYKVPSLRNVEHTAPYMHAGQFKDLNEVMKHYDNAPETVVGESELRRIKISFSDRELVEAFLLSLSAEHIEGTKKEPKSH